ncbi:hypothetical protein QP324_08910 [Corynebacterium sp. UMB0012]|uniref:hypothetical protein n=1 Tax=Corynebacterium sp. UMB0012 TaxID=3046344 RepID=UPI00254BA6DD|nr:hypothetical protein [Corynebacterium sp. UMB0012]MDK7048693.1 hypothetical protein [Corynebacterium sp. UMB0012]
MNDNTWDNITGEDIEAAYVDELPKEMNTNPQEVLAGLFKAIKLARRNMMIISTQASVPVAANTVDIAFQDISSAVKMAGEIVNSRASYEEADAENNNQEDNNEG